jgi:hypothetical protein
MKGHRLGVFEDRALNGIFEPKTEEVRGSWRKIRIEDLHGLYSAPCIVRVMKSRRMRER